MQELQQLKRVQLGQDADQDMDYNPLLLAIQAKIVSPIIRVPKEKFNGTINLTDHVTTFESHVDLYSMIDAAKCMAFSKTFRGVVRSWYDSLPI